MTGYNWGGFTLPVYVPKILKGEVYTLGFKYKIRRQLDHEFVVVIKNHSRNKAVLTKIVANPQTSVSSGWQEFQGTFKMTEDLDFDQVGNFPIYFYLVKNGWVEIKEPMLVRGPRTGSFKPSQFDEAYRNVEATRTQMTLLSNSWSVRTLNGPGDVLGAINLNPDGSVKINEGLISVGEKTYIKDGVIKKSMIGNAQIGTAHIGEIDANIARLINVSAKNIVSDGLTANVIRGGKLSSLNGVTDFDLQTGWIEMNQAGVGIRNQFAGRPLQYLIFGQGSIRGKDGSYTALMSNSRNQIAMNDASAGIQIWNTNDNTSAVNIYGDVVEFMYNANDPKSIVFDNIKNEIRNIETIWIKEKSLELILNDIFWNFRVLSDGGAKLPYKYFKYWNGDK